MRSPSSTPGTSPDVHDRPAIWPDARAQWLALAAIVVVAGVARFFRIGLDSFWLDETASWWFASRPLAEQWGQVPFYEPHPPLYYTLLWLWSRLVGEGEAALRGLSAAASVLTVPVVYGMGRVALPGKDGKWIGLVGALIAALYPTQIAYAQEARAYALLTLTVAVLIVCLLWLVGSAEKLNRPWRAIIRDRSSGVRLAVAGTVLATSISFWLHNTALILVSPLLVVAALLIFSRAGFSWQLVRKFLAMGVAILVLWSPNIQWLLSGLSEISSGFWLQPPRWLDLAWGGDELLGSGGTAYEIPWKAGSVGVSLVLLAMGAIALSRRGQVAAAVLLSSPVMLPIGIAVIASYVITPIFMTRVLLWIEIPAVVLVAASSLWLPSLFLRQSAVAIAAGWLAIVLALGWGRQVKEPWNEVARIIAEEAQPDDLIIADTAYAQVPMLYYRIPERTSARWLPLPEPYPLPLGESGYPDGFFLRGSISELTVEMVRQAAADSRRIWHVTRGDQVYDSRKRVAGTLRAARGLGIVRVSSGTAALLTEYRASLNSAAVPVPSAAAAPMPAASGR